MKKGLAILIVLAILLAAGTAVFTALAKDRDLTPAPEAVFTDFDGNAVSLESFQGKPLYIKFWASWCSICLSSLRETDELAGMDSDFTVITVVAPGVDGEKKMRKASKHGTMALTTKTLWCYLTRTARLCAPLAYGHTPPPPLSTRTAICSS